MNLKQSVLQRNTSDVTKSLNTQDVTQDTITDLKKSIKRKKDPNDVLNLLDTSGRNSHIDYKNIDNMLNNYIAVDTMRKASNVKWNRDIDNTIRSFLGGKKTRKSRKNRTKETKSKKAKRTNKHKPRK
tara:strand:- start:1336 stop:1719 length:384 start_codon:yes stop_codon:yes gene_type:complete